MEFLKKYWGFIAIALVILVFIFVVIPFINAKKDENNNKKIADFQTKIALLDAKKKADSAVFSQKEIAFKKESLRKDSIIKAKEKGISVLITYRDRELKRVDSLSNDNSIKYLVSRIDPLVAKIIPVVLLIYEKDTLPLLPISYVKAINHELVEGQYCQMERDSLYPLIVTLKAKITDLTSFSSLQNDQITNIRNDLNSCLGVSKEENVMLVKQNKKIKNKNIFMGVLSGVAGAAILVAVLK